MTDYYSKPNQSEQERTSITRLFLCVQFGWHFFDSIQALKRAASLFRNTEKHKT